MHVDVKKQAVIPPGGSHSAQGRAGTRNGSMSKRRGLPGDPLGRRHPHPLRSEVLDAENAEQCTAFLARAHRDFAERGIATYGLRRRSPSETVNNLAGNRTR